VAAGDARQALVDAARKEGSLTWYSTNPPGAVNRIAKAFEAKYGLKVEFVRASSTELTQRYAAEAQSGKSQADVIDAPAPPFFMDAQQRGWTVALDKAGIPALDRKELSETFYRPDQGAAVYVVLTWVMGYNTRQVVGDKVPKDWDALLSPDWKGKILLVDPRIADAFFEFWDRIMLVKGEDFLTRLKAQDPRLTPGSSQGTESIAAGEGAFVLPVSGPSVNAVKNNGAPVDIIQPDLTVGIETAIGITNKAQHPSAARLFVDYVLSKEGNAVANGDPGAHSPYGSDFPKNYFSPRKEAMGNKAKILQLLGVS
jgi:iron(III) transport system substrate-binding protein